MEKMSMTESVSVLARPMKANSYGPLALAYTITGSECDSIGLKKGQEAHVVVKRTGDAIILTITATWTLEDEQ